MKMSGHCKRMQGGRGEVKEISMSSQVIIFLDDAYEALAMY